LDKPAALAAHVVIYMMPRDAEKPSPYYLLVNGHRVEGIPVPWHERVWHWVPINVGYLEKGENTVELACDAPDGQGYDVLFARADEYERGGGDWSYLGNTAMVTSSLMPLPNDPVLAGFEPIVVGHSSGKSMDGGKTWTIGKLGPENDTSGEYTIRLSLNRYHESGSVTSDPIDLWAGLKGYEGIVPQCDVTELQLTAEGDSPDGTGIEWSVRFADTKDPTSTGWGEFERIGREAGFDASLDNQSKRFVQVRARLTTTSPLTTPVVQSVIVSRTLEFDPPPGHTFYVHEVENPAILYSSYALKFEDASEPQLQTLRKRLDLDALLAGIEGDFERINRVRHKVSQLWYHAPPECEYPEWNALDILDRKEKYGAGGMCMQFTTVFMQSLQSIGYQGRHVNLFNHEAHEVYVDELGKWVAVDPESVFDSYEFNTETGKPVSILEQHRYFLKRYGFTGENPIPWMSPEPWCNWPNVGLPEEPQPLDISTDTGWIADPDPSKRPPHHNLAGFVRIIPRTNFLSQPTPRPLANGRTYWPWSGFLCWYDAATPRKLQYALHTDREADLYPTLNRVGFTATHGDVEGVVEIQMNTQTPNFETYEINIDGGGWSDSTAHVPWALRPGALNTIEMRVRNTLGVRGKPSRLQILWHHRAPFAPKPKK
jgi:hypothetical protein